MNVGSDPLKKLSFSDVEMKFLGVESEKGDPHQLEILSENNNRTIAGVANRIIIFPQVVTETDSISQEASPNSTAGPDRRRTAHKVEIHSPYYQPTLSEIEKQLGDQSEELERLKIVILRDVEQVTSICKLVIDYEKFHDYLTNFTQIITNIGGVNANYDLFQKKYFVFKLQLASRQNEHRKKTATNLPGLEKYEEKIRSFSELSSLYTTILALLAQIKEGVNGKINLINSKIAFYNVTVLLRVTVEQINCYRALIDTNQEISPHLNDYFTPAISTYSSVEIHRLLVLCQTTGKGEFYKPLLDLSRRQDQFISSYQNITFHCSKEGEIDVSIMMLTNQIINLVNGCRL